ncbi:hypothetical protein [Streptomyces xanthophaeus]|uniref:hypothetical protein n=1 Tax=Streptomyces xanthophaeus TaxID=67385 RepID=UPI002648AC67|nr:hypothetical protein [Streptomyces xanthophaeus]WKD30630.1 hypothetical protein KO717_00675 [Streptomyces xanthophaeus]
MTGTRAVFGNRADSGGTLKAVFRAWTVEFEYSPMAEHVEGRLITWTLSPDADPLTGAQ